MGKTREERVNLCGKAVNNYEGVDSGLLYKHILYCKDVTCPVCGRMKGAIHKVRIKNVRKKIARGYGSLSGLGFGNFVFTVPEHLRDSFRSREDLNALTKIAEKAVKPFLAGRFAIVSIHPFGDRDDRFKPHINISVVHRLLPGRLLRLSKEDLETIQKRFVKSLNKKGYCCDAANIHYSFTLDVKRFFHSLRYFTRPCPDYDILERLKVSDPELYGFFTSENMRKFQYIRSLKSVVDADQYVEGDKVQKLEKLKFVDSQPFKWLRFIEEVRQHERIEVCPGIWAIREGGLTEADYKFLGVGGVSDG